MKALIISNDDVTRTMVLKTLTYNGFDVHTACESAFAWKHLQEIRFDFIMLDLNLKNESGLSFYKSLRQIENNIPVIMMGEGALDRFILTDLSTENYDFVMKPLKFNVLKEKINFFLNQTSLAENLKTFDGFKIDCRQKLLIIKDHLVQLSSVEIDILLILAERRGEIIHPTKIAKLIHKNGKIATMSMFFYMSKLKGKLQDMGQVSFDISFIKDQGYVLA